ncbi:MAG: glycosyltransferase family 4 protein [Candidatus Omnitrophota bacterium]
MNILYLTTHLNIGGITSYLLTLTAGLKSRGHNVYIASWGGETVSRFREKGITIIPIPIKTKSEISPKVLLSFCKLLPVIKKEHIDIIHCNSRVTQVLGCLLSSFSRKPFISTCHGFFKTRFSRRTFPCWGKKVIAISQQVKTHLMQDFNVQEEDIVVINNGVDVKKPKDDGRETRDEIKKRFNLKQCPVVGIIGRLSDVKGHIYLIEAMKKVLEKNPEAQLFIVGEGRMKDKIISLIKKLNIEKQAVIIPSVADTAAVLPIIDLFVMPSLKEGLGLSLMEAMAAGLAVIGSDVGGIKSLIQHNHTGLLVKPADSQGLSNAILELLDDSQKRKTLGDNAREFIARNFSAEQMVNFTEKAYNDCLKWIS